MPFWNKKKRSKKVQRVKEIPKKEAPPPYFCGRCGLKAHGLKFVDHEFRAKYLRPRDWGYSGPGEDHVTDWLKCPRCGNRGMTLSEDFEDGYIKTPIHGWTPHLEKVWNMRGGVGEWWRRQDHNL